jgi:hypothetical protein
VVIHIAVDDEERVPLENKILVKVIDVARMSRQSSTGGNLLRRNPFVRAVALGALGKVQHLRVRHKGPIFDGDLLRVETFGAPFDRLWLEAAPSFDFVAERSSAFLNWRYADPRGGEHTVFAAWDGEQALGYIAFRMYIGRGQILDILTLPGRADVARA